MTDKEILVNWKRKLVCACSEQIDGCERNEMIVKELLAAARREAIRECIAKIKDISFKRHVDFCDEIEELLNPKNND